MFKLLAQLFDFVLKAITFYVQNSPDAAKEADDIIQAFDELDGQDNLASSFSGSNGQARGSVRGEAPATTSGEEASRPGSKKQSKADTIPAERS